MRDFNLYLKDILKAIGAIEGFIDDMTLDQFLEDDKTSSAVLRKLEIIGEASKGIPEDFKKLNADIPWKNMAAMRDKLIHAYFGINHKVVWETIKIHLPSLKLKISQLLESLD